MANGCSLLPRFAALSPSGEYSRTKVQNVVTDSTADCYRSLIETKTVSKWVGHNLTIKYDVVRVLIDGVEPDRDPIRQVRACCRNRDAT